MATAIAKRFHDWSHEPQLIQYNDARLSTVALTIVRYKYDDGWWSRHGVGEPFYELDAPSATVAAIQLQYKHGNDAQSDDDRLAVTVANAIAVIPATVKVKLRHQPKRPGQPGRVQVLVTHLKLSLLTTLLLSCYS